MSHDGPRLVVAIDGPAGAGKSTLARALAALLGYAHVDSGAMYRVVGLAARERGIDSADAVALAALVDGLDFVLAPDPRGQRVLLEGRDVTDALRTPPAGEWASRVAAIPEVRSRLVARQLASRRLIVERSTRKSAAICAVCSPSASCRRRRLQLRSHASCRVRAHGAAEE